MKKMAFLLALIMALFCSCAQAEGMEWLKDALGDMTQAVREGASGAMQATERPQKQHLAMLYIEGELIEGDSYYDHVGTLTAIEDLMYDDENAALFLVFNTPGGGLYESDELHHTIMTYKQATGRPVYAYMKQECCSGGVYAAMAADAVYASKMTITGSVGVYVNTYSEAGLLEKLGIENEYIASGKNKVPGYPELTDEQRAIYQSVVDEGFAYFREALALARKLSDEQMQGFLDGRLLTAAQAKAAGLIDDVLYYDEFEEKIESLHHQAPIRDKTPQDGFSAGGAQMLKWLLEQMPGGKSGAQKQLCPGGLMS